MTDKTPSALTAASAKDGTESIHVEQGGNSRKMTPGEIAGWTLIDSFVWSTNVPEVDFTSGLDVFSDIRILMSAMQLGTSGLRSLRVSDDGGSSFLASSGDYQTISAAGALTNAASIPLHGTNATAARYGEAIIRGFNRSEPKSVDVIGGGLYLIPVANPLNALRIFPSGGGNITAGSLYLFGR